MLKYEEPILVARPNSVEEIKEARKSPAQYISQSLDHQLAKSQNQIYSTGYALTPIRGSNRSTTIISLDNILLGTMLFGQDVLDEDAKVNSYISDSDHIHAHGATFNVDVGRMTANSKDNPRNSHHHYKWTHIPFTDNDQKYLIGWDSRASTQGAEPTFGQFFFRYPSGRRRASDRDATFLDEHAIAGYLSIIHSQWKNSTVPLEMSPIIIPSKCTAQFYKRLRNQVVVEDATKKKGFRGLYKFERSALLSRFTGIYGTSNTWSWSSDIDGKVREYFIDPMHQDQA